MNRFDKLYKKIIMEYVDSKQFEEIEKKIKDMFFEIMPDACDLAKLEFNSQREKEIYIEGAWEEYSDDIIEYVEGAVGDEQLSIMDDDRLTELVQEAISANSASILGKDIFE